MIEAIDYHTGVENAWSNVATFIPKLVVFLVILVVGYIVAKAVTKMLSRVLTKVGFDVAVERGGIRKALESSQYDASDILAKLVFCAIMLFVLSTAFGVFGPNPISDYLHAVISYLPLVFVAILIIVIASAVAAAAKTLIQGSCPACPTDGCWPTAPPASSWRWASSPHWTSRTSRPGSSTRCCMQSWPRWSA